MHHNSDLAKAWLWIYSRPSYKNLYRGLNSCLRNSVPRTKLHHLVFVCWLHIRDLRNRVLKQRAPTTSFPSILDLPQSRIACHFAHLLTFHLIHVDKANDSDDEAKASGAGAHHTHTRHKTGSNTRLGQREDRPSNLHNGSRTDSSGISQRVTCHGQEAQSKGTVSSVWGCVPRFL